MKTITLFLALLFPVSCAQVEQAFAEYPAIVIVEVTEASVEFEVQNNTSSQVFYMGWEEGSAVACSEVQRGEKWYPSYSILCATGSDWFRLAPGASFRDSLPNMNEGPMRVGLSFALDQEWDSESWFNVDSDLHEDWVSD